MPESRRFRLSALIAGAAVIAASVLPAIPASAEDVPTPEPTTSVVEPVETTPSADPTPEATDPVAEPVETPAAQPTEDPTPTPTPTATASSAGTVTYTGTAQQFSEDGFAIDADVVQFEVAGLGFLTVDLSSISTRIDALNPVTLTLQIPAGLTLSADADTRFTQLATASGIAPLVAIRTGKIKHDTPDATAQLVNQTPNVPATHHVFAVYVSPYNKKVKDPGQTNNTAAQNLVNYADSYWAAQSGGNIHFTLDGVVPWYQSTYSCSSQSGSSSLWSQALTKAKALGYVPGKNNHLALIFPNDTSGNYNYCGGAIGLGTVGGSVNQGGQIWVMGNTDPMAKETIAHELGHNMSLGHADWLACPSATPLTGKGSVNAWSGSSRGSVVGCTTHNYGDTTDVMGFGIGDGVSGSLSAPQAIRAGIWPAGTWSTPGIGTNTYTLSAVGAHTGIRALVIQDRDGTQYFVEYRNLVGDDSTNYIGCDSQACTLNVPHVRLLRLEPTDYQGWPGEDSFLIGRSNTNIGWVNSAFAQTYTLPGGNSFTITANGITGSGATISVTRSAPGAVVNDDLVYLTRTLGYDSTLRVGDTLTLLIGDWYNVENYTFFWTRDGSTSGMPNTQNYTLQPADVGHRINAYLNAGGGDIYELDEFGDPITTGYLISKGVYQPSDPGPVTTDFSSTPFTVTTPVGGAGNWPTGTTFTYQWLRGASATTATTNATGAGATTTSYLPNAADYNQYLRVKVTATVPGYNPVVRYSTPAVNRSIFTQSPLPVEFKVSGTPKIGTQVTVDTSTLAFFDVGGSTIPTAGVTLSYQWLRNGIPISDTPAATLDATDDTDYTLRSLDYNANITLRVTASKSGYVSKTLATANFKPTQLGTIQATTPTASITNAFDAAAPMKVTLTAAYSGVTETELSAPGYQWYRVNLTSGVATAITGATAAVYKPVAADYPYKLRVIVSIKKPNYTTLPLTYTHDFSIRIDPATPLSIQGTARVDNAIGASNPDMHVTLLNDAQNTVNFGSPGVTTTFQWRRAGVNIAGANASGYLPVAADVAKALSYTVKVEYSGWIGSTFTSPNSPAVALATFSHNQDVAIVSTGLQKHAVAAANDVTPFFGDTKVTYQWTRDGVAITGKTTADYTLTSADFGHVIRAKVSYSRPGYATFTQNDVNGSGNYWIRSNALPTFTGSQEVGGTLTVEDRGYFDMIVPVDGMTIGTGHYVESYQWYRSGVAIPGATNKSYTLQAADKTKAITVKVTVTGAPGEYTYDLPNIQTSAATPAIGLHIIPNADTAPLPTLAVQGSSTPTVTVLGTTGTGLASPGGPANTVAYQWYRMNKTTGALTAITGATKSTYALTQADRNFFIKLRITTSHPAIGTATYTTDVRFTSGYNEYTLLASGAETIYSISGGLEVGGKLGATQPAYADYQGNAVFPVVRTYQWLRNGVAIAGPVGTASTYVLQAADVGAKISVRVTTGQVGYIPLITTYATTPPTQVIVKGTLIGTGVPATVTVNNPATNELIATPPAVTGSVDAGSPSATFTYQWLRNGVNIVGATAQKYKLTAADWGKNVKVRIQASLAGYVTPAPVESTPIDYSITLDGDPNHVPRASGGSWTVGTGIGLYDYTLFADKDENPVTSPTIAIQWLRSGVAIAGATTDSYLLVAADYGKTVTARVTVSKPGYVPLVFITNGYAVGKGITSDTWYPVVQEGPAAGVLTADVSDLDPPTPTPTYTYKWFRNGVAITGATAKTYKLVAADAGKLIKVQVTMSRLNFEAPLHASKFSAEAAHTLYAGATKPTITGTAAVGLPLSATAPGFFEDVALTMPATGITPVYTWYRSGLAIAGATTDIYTLTSADLGKVITVKVTATQAGRLAAVSPASLPTATVVAGTIQVGSLAPAWSLNMTTRKATISFTGSAVTPSVTKTYQWYRNNVAISGATASTFVLSTTDTNKSISVVVKLSKAGFTTYTYVAAPGQLINGFSKGEDPAVTGGTDLANGMVGQELSCVAPIYYRADGLQFEPGVNAGDTQVLQWTRNGAAIPGATGYHYTVDALDSGQSISCTVTNAATLHKTTTDSSANVLTIS